MTRRLAQYLYLRAPLEMEVDETELPSATTLSLKLCASNKGNPPEIAPGVLVTIGAVNGRYRAVISSTALVAALGAAYVTKRVWGFLYDDAGSYFDVFEFVVTDIDPDLLPALTA